MNKIMQLHWKILGEIYFIKKKKTEQKLLCFEIIYAFFIISNVNFIPGDKCFKKNDFVKYLP